MTAATTAVVHSGPYDLALSLQIAGRAAFVADRPSAPAGTLEIAFLLDGTWEPVGVRVVQHADGAVRAHLVDDPAGAPAEAVRDQVARMLSLDVPGAALPAVLSDAGLDDLAARFPGLRPVQFASPYEAAARAIIGHRLPVRQAAAVSARVAEQSGVALTIGGRRMTAFPTPERLAELGFVRGLSARKVEQLRGLGAAAADGRLGATRLRALDRVEAMRQLQTLAGIGPFSAELILIRGAGDPDAFPRTEPKLHRGMAARYGVDEDDLEGLERIAEAWRPYRSWAGLLLREAWIADAG